MESMFCLLGFGTIDCDADDTQGPEGRGQGLLREEEAQFPGFG